MTLTVRVLAGLLMIGLVAAGRASAIHAVDHRYVVLSYVRDPAGRPLTHRSILLVREKTGLPYRAETDAEGFYVLVVHLHDEDLLDVLHLLAEGTTVRIRAQFDPLDRQRPRGTRTDFIGDQTWERQDMFSGTLEQYLQR